MTATADQREQELNRAVEVALALVFGLLIGGVVGTVGGGGAILALPVLVYVLGEDAGPATTASLVVVAVAASFGASAQAREGQLCWRMAVAFSIPAAIGAYIGTLASAQASARTLVLAFVPVMLLAATVTYSRAGSAETSQTDSDCPPVRLPASTASGFGVGVLTGFFGVGGGFLIVPVLTTFLRLSMRRAIATSLAIISLTGLAALLSHLAEGAEPDWPLTAALSGGAAIGALIGTSLGRRLDTKILARAFAGVVVAVATLLVVDVLTLGGPS